MSSAFSKAPWWALWIMGLVGQANLAALGYYVRESSWHAIGVGCLVALVAVAMVYGPAAAGKLARSSGAAIREARDDGDDKPEVKP